MVFASGGTRIVTLDGTVSTRLSRVKTGDRVVVVGDWGEGFIDGANYHYFRCSRIKIGIVKLVHVIDCLDINEMKAESHDIHIEVLNRLRKIKWSKKIL
ncbi:MAG: hypothetical protein ACOX4H_03165 [Bacillota bacterium]